MDTKDVLAPNLRQKVFDALLEFIAWSGVSEEEIRNSFEKGLRRLRLDSCVCRQDGRYVGNGNVSAELLRVWHRDARCIDDDARPRPLFLFKGRNSLRALIRRLDPSADASEVLRGMRAVGLIRRTTGGRYRPTAESVTIATLHPLAIEHVAKSVVRLVSTVCRNTDPTGCSLPLIEKYAYVPDLNRADRREFADFTRSQGMAYLEAVDDWLEQRRARRVYSSRRARAEGVSAGVHLVAYLGDNPSGPAVGTKRASMAKIRLGARTQIQNASSKRPTPPREVRA